MYKQIICLICGITLGFVIGFGVHQYNSQRVLDPPGIIENVEIKSDTPAVKESPKVKYKNPCDKSLDGKKLRLVFSKEYKLYAVQFYDEGFHRWTNFTTTDYDDWVYYPMPMDESNTFKDSCTAKLQTQKLVDFWKKRDRENNFANTFK